MRLVTKLRISSLLFWLGISLALIGFLGSENLLQPQYILSGLLALAAIVTIASILIGHVLGKARFAIYALPDDPGHYNLRENPPFALKAGRQKWSEWPGTYPRDRKAPASQRMTFLWETTPGVRKGLQYKFAVVEVKVRWHDAVDCTANASVKVVNGTSTSLPVGEWFPIGNLNWYSDSVETGLLRLEEHPDGSKSLPNLEWVLNNPTFGLNERLRNPSNTIHEGASQHLALFYMRGDQPDVQICGPNPALSVEPPIGGGPVLMEFEITVTALKSVPQLVRFHGTANWDALALSRIEDD